VRELGLAADRERIARDLHDTVIQRLFATGLSLQAAIPLARDDRLRERVEQAIEDLDDIISQVRTTIFALEPPPGSEKGTRARVLEICADARRSLGFDPEVRFVGPIDGHVFGYVATELLSTLREALSNVARHARAGRVEVELTVTDAVTLSVTDDGVGVDIHHDDPVRASGGHGLPNMAARAEALGGEFVASRRPGGGTYISWRVPLPRAGGEGATASAPGVP
jgi:signal transduction histidine kinase